MLTSCGSSGPAPTVLAEPGTEAVVDLRVGEEFTVRLVSNPSTGYRWGVAPGSEQVVQLVGEPALAAADTPPVGAPGTQTFTFRALAPGEAPLQLDYARSREGQAVKSYSVRVHVRE